MQNFIYPDMIPRETWKRNLRAELNSDQWDRIRRESYRRAGYRCEICGGRGGNWPVECHEIWRFETDGRRGIQFLAGVQSLCPNCHAVKHWGRSSIVERDMAKFRDHIAEVTNWPLEVVSKAIMGAWATWEERNKIKWRVDYSQAPIMIRNILAEGKRIREVEMEVLENTDMAINALTLDRVERARQEIFKKIGLFEKSPLAKMAERDYERVPEAKFPRSEKNYLVKNVTGGVIIEIEEKKKAPQPENHSKKLFRRLKL